VVLDGEIVAFDSTGAPSFQVLQRRMNLSSRAAAEAAATIPVSLVAFDLLWEAGESLVTLPLEERRRRLTALRLERVVIPDPVPREGTALFRAVVERGLEGMVAKRLGSTYQPGRRSPDWRKVVHRRSARFVVGGYLPGEGGRSASFGSLVLGLWDGETLRFVGSVGSGFDDRSLRLVRHAIDQIGRSTSPFRAGDVVPPAARWVEPALVAVVEFRQWTGDNHLRAPVFKGFTTDPVGEVTWEAEGP
jgi:bifunctional non-homologous end joining protein LigD